MRKILGLILLVISLQGFSQPSGYQYRTVRERLLAFIVDSGLHVPRYNGVPSGLRNGVYVADGLISMDTLNGNFYGYRNGAWFRVANYSDIAASSGQKFGHPSGDFRDAVNNRDFSLAGNGRMFIDSASNYWVAFKTTGGKTLSFYDYETTKERFGIDFTKTGLYSPNQATNFRVYNDTAFLELQSTASKFIVSNIPYNSGAALVGLAIDTVTNRVYRKTAGGGSTNFANTDLTFTGNRIHTMDGETLKLNDGGVEQFFIDPVNKIYALGNQDEIYGWQVRITGDQDLGTAKAVLGSASDNTNFEINDNHRADIKFGGTLYFRASEVDGALWKGIDAGVGTKSIRYNPSTGLITYADTTSGGSGGTVTSVSRTNGFGISASVANPTTTPDITIAVDSSVLVTKSDWGRIRDSLQQAGWGNQSVNHDYRWYIDMSGSTHANGFFSSSGTASSAIVFITPPAVGWWFGRDLNTGTDANGRAWLLAQSGAYSPISISTSYRYSVGTRVRFEDLSTGTQRYGFYFGFGDDANAYSNIVDGLGLRYIDTDSSGNFIAWAKNNTTTTEVDTGVPVAADQDYTLQITGIGGSFYYYIDGVLVATISTNLPVNDIARLTSLSLTIHKTVGTTPRHCYVEWLGYDKRDD